MFSRLWAALLAWLGFRSGEAAGADARVDADLRQEIAVDRAVDATRSTDPDAALAALKNRDF